MHTRFQNLNTEKPPNSSLISLHQSHVEIIILIYRVNVLFNDQNMGQP